MRLLALIASMLIAAATAAQAQAPKSASEATCMPGFVERANPHGVPHNFGCRTPLIQCPERRGYRVLTIPEKFLDTASGMQFGYRCEYHSVGG